MNTPTTETIKRRINKEIYALGVYHPEIPLSDIFSIVERHAGKVVQEDGTTWSGWLCGEDGEASFQIETRKRFWLRIQWHKMQSGNYEITAYVS
jgi:hypothetical protein